MKVLELRDIKKKESLVHYRRVFTGSAVLELVQEKKVNKPVEFILEHTPTGKTNIQVQLLDDINYPLVPAIKSLKEYISDLESKGLLP